jgi:hypothetical protein
MSATNRSIRHENGRWSYRTSQSDLQRGEAEPKASNICSPCSGETNEGIWCRIHTLWVPFVQLTWPVVESTRVMANCDRIIFFPVRCLDRLYICLPPCALVSCESGSVICEWWMASTLSTRSFGLNPCLNYALKSARRLPSLSLRRAAMKSGILFRTVDPFIRVFDRDLHHLCHWYSKSIKPTSMRHRILYHQKKIWHLDIWVDTVDVLRFPVAQYTD